MQPSARPMSIWARPLLVGLLAFGLLATASVAIAAPSVVHPPVAQLVPPPAVPVAPVLVSAPAVPVIVGPTDLAPLTLAPPQVPVVRPQVGAQVKSVALPSKATAVAAKHTVVTTKPKAVVKHVTASYSGVYHLWIPALDLSRSISDWGCNGGLIPNRVEYWGCAGRNNLYLLGHAWGVFAPIHDGYHSGALRVGLTAYFADKSGTVHRYRISQIRHVANKDYATWSQWAMASSSSRIITLQTCDGSTSAYRILVRLVLA